MFKLAAFSLLALSAIVVDSNNHHNLRRSDNALHPRAHNLLGRQACDADHKPCGAGCIWADQVCCDDGTYCFAGSFCYQGGVMSCCSPGWVVCGVGCMAPDNKCCDVEAHWCGPLEYCCIKNTGELACCLEGATYASTSITATTTYPTGSTLLGPAGTTSLPATTSAASTSSVTTTPSSTSSSPTLPAEASSTTTSAPTIATVSTDSTTTSAVAPTVPIVTASEVSTSGSAAATSFTGAAMVTATFARSDLLAALYLVAGHLLL